MAFDGANFTPNIVNFMGLGFHALDADAVLDAVAARASIDAPFAYVATPNVDHMVGLSKEPGRRPLYQSAWMLVNDSSVLARLARKAGIRLPVATGADLVERLFDSVIDRHEPITIIGGERDAIDALARRYRLTDVRWHQPPMGLKHKPGAIVDAAEFAAKQGARFTLICVGAPQQEMIAYAMHARGDATGVGLCAGAACAAGTRMLAGTLQSALGVDRSRESDPKWHYPSCRWTAEEEAKFIANHLGPAFEAAGVSTEIWTYDHNFNESPGPEGDDPGIDYPRTVLLSDAAKYVRGVAFHGYWGRPSGMSVLHRDFPAVPVYFTEGSMYGAKGALTIIDIFRNHASSYNAWVTMIDDARGPNNGPFEADWTMAVHDRETNSVSYTFDYFMYGQFSKFVKRGAVRVDSTEGDRRVNNVAFRNPDGSMVVIVSNAGANNVARTLRWNEHSAELTLPPRSVVTLRWTSGTG